MCILCVASRWSRRIVTMLPWLIIPLIILWALSQLLPPGFRFEVTSPRLACVGVLLVSLGWYELVMPKLSAWRARRSAMLRERQRIQAQEAAKWRKEATRRCRNCLTAYKDQTPCGGRFTCTYCGHVSKRPVLDIPGGGPSIAPGFPSGVVSGGSFSGPNPSGVLMNGGTILTGRLPRGVGTRGLSDRHGWGGGKEWASGRPWANDGGGWGVTSSWMGCSFSNSGGYFGGGANWGGSSSHFGGGVLGGEKCRAGESYSKVFVFILKIFSYLFPCLGWIGEKLLRIGRSRDDSMTGGRRPERNQEDGGSAQVTRIEKARRKAEEKRQARLEKELLEEEERKQREEVARLVEERRRQRDEKLEAEKESEREAAAEREREIRREKDAERRRHEKANRAKDKNKECELEDIKKKGIEAEKRDTEKGEWKEDAKGVISIGAESRKIAKAPKTSGSRCSGSGKGGLFSPSKNTGVPLNNSTSFWGRNFASGGKFGRGAVPVSSSTSSSNSGFSGKITDGSSSSAWKRIPWTWGKGTVLPAAENTKIQVGTMDASCIKLDQDGVKHSHSEVASNVVASVTAGVPQKPLAAPPSQTNSWARLFFSPTISPVEPLSDRKIEGIQDQDSESRSATETISSIDQVIFGDSAPIPSLVSECFPSLLSEAQSAEPSTTVVVCSSIAEPQKTDVRNSFLGPVSDSLLTSFPADVGTSISPSIISSPLSPIGEPISNSINLPSSIQTPGKKCLDTCEDTSYLGNNIMPQILEPWGLPPLSSDESIDNNSDGRWQMWGSPQLHQIKLPDPSPWISHLNDRSAESNNGLFQPVPLSTSPLPFEPEFRLSPCLFSMQQQNRGIPKQNGDEISPLFPPSSSFGIWSSPSAFESATRIWEDPDIYHRQPPEFIDCITQELMQDPVITADGHTYERSAIEAWLKFHDTSPKTGEVLPPPPGGDGTGVDKTLRPNHILRGQIIEYKERIAQQSSLKGANDRWGTSSPIRSSPSWSTASSTVRPPCIGGFYTTPGVQSVWSYKLP